MGKAKNFQRNNFFPKGIRKRICPTGSDKTGYVKKEMKNVFLCKKKYVMNTRTNTVTLNIIETIRGLKKYGTYSRLDYITPLAYNS